MMEILSESKLLTTNSPPSGFNARCTGLLPTSSSASTLSVFKSIEATCDEPLHATNALLLSGRIAMSVGCAQIGSVERTYSSCVLIKETELSPRLLTTRVNPSGETLASPGSAPTRILVMTACFSRSITETLAECELATYP